jgi:LacI family transcriptional regulator
LGIHEQKSVTIKDIARIAGVSHSTVSRSLNDSSLISAATKQKIKRIAGELNFAFDSSARSLSTGKTGSVAVIFPRLFDYFGNSLYMGMLIQGVRHGFDRFSIDSISTFANNEFTGESNIRRLISRRKIDGLLIVHPEIDPGDWEYIEKSGLPFVVLHFKPRSYSYSKMNYLFTDHVHGGELATKKLIDAGCRRILCLREDSKEPQFIERTRGYEQAIRNAGLPVDRELILHGLVSFEFGYNSIMEMKDRLHTIDGIFAQADLIAIGCIEALKALKISVPEDLMVVGYDDTELGAIFHPRLTSVHQPREEHARLACSRLVELIEGADDPPMQLVVKPQLIVRESCP